ncbi:MAG: hypothetical protein M0C28_27405 [Candidatus Moduliflexus flocculans]|nr:hypothetical protein [Candidatus Moduliflexus flocculans]
MIVGILRLVRRSAGAPARDAPRPERVAATRGARPEGLAGTVSVERIVLLEAEAPVILERIRIDPEATGRGGPTIRSRRSSSGWPITGSERGRFSIVTGRSASPCRRSA